MPEMNPRFRKQPAGNPAAHPVQPTRIRGWKRTAVCALLLLAGGAVVNVAVAWGLAFRGTPETASDSSRPYFNSEPEFPFWSMELAEGPGWARAFWFGDTGIFANGPGGGWALALGLRPRERREIRPPHWSRMDWQTPPRANQWPSLRVDDARGWPALSLASHVRMEVVVSPTQPIATITTSRAWIVDDTQLQQFVLDAEWTTVIVPFRPVFPGFIINTLFYGLFLWLLFAAPFAARRLLRRSRGQCRKCAYPIGVSRVCTECGAAVRPAPVAR